LYAAAGEQKPRGNAAAATATANTNTRLVILILLAMDHQASPRTQPSIIQPNR